MSASAVNTRDRGWLVIPVAHWDAVTAFLKKEMGNLDNENVFIRAMMLESWPGGGPVILLAVDAEPGGFQSAKTYALTEMKIEPDDVGDILISDTYPRPPHLASGFISPGEFEEDREEIHHKNKAGNTFAVLVEIGRQDNSPGFNPWG